MRFCSIFTIVFIGFCNILSANVSVTVQELTAMANARYPEYTNLRDAIIQRGNDILPYLKEIYTNNSLDWEPRFAAGVCMEHIQKADALHEMLHYDWRKIPGFNESGSILATGYPRGCESIVEQKLLEFGCWFYLLELYGGYLPEAESSDYRLFRDKEKFILRNSTEDIRYFASCIVNHLVEMAYADCPTIREFIIGWPLEHLAEYIHDGTFPEGLHTIYSHLDQGGKIIDSFVDEIIDPVLLSDLSNKYRDNVGVRVMLQNRLQAISVHMDIDSNADASEKSSLSNINTNSILSLNSIGTEPLNVSERKHIYQNTIIVLIICIAAFFITTLHVLFHRRHHS